jgi:hypothetical protein
MGAEPLWRRNALKKTPVLAHRKNEGKTLPTSSKAPHASDRLQLLETAQLLESSPE